MTEHTRPLSGVSADILKRSPDFQKTTTVYTLDITHFFWLQEVHFLTKISDTGAFSCRVNVKDVDASVRHHLNTRNKSIIKRIIRNGDTCCCSLSCVRRLRSCAFVVFLLKFE